MYDGTPCIVTASEANRNNWGYARCLKYRFGMKINTRHRLAWIDHHGCLPPEDKPWILHHCDNPPCENALHLYAGTPLDNARDVVRRGRGGRRGRGSRRTDTSGLIRLTGEDHRSAKLTEEIVREARGRYEEGEPIVQIAARYGVTPSVMSKAVRRVTWRHIP